MIWLDCRASISPTRFPQLEERFGQDLTEQKAAIKDITIRVLSQHEEGEEEEDDGSNSSSDDSSSGDEEEEEGGGGVKAKKKASTKGGGFNKEYAWSEEMTAFLGQGYMSRPQVRSGGVPVSIQTEVST